MRTLFANYFCDFLPKTFLGFVLHIAEYRIDLFYVYGIWGLSAGSWGLSAGYQPRPQVVDRGRTARYGGQLRYI